MPRQRKDIIIRLPPHLERELQRLISTVPGHLRQPSNSDMVGTLIFRASRDPEGLLDDLAAYFTVLDAWRRDGTETLQ